MTVSDLFVALGLLFVAEGVLYAVAPGLARRAAASLLSLPADRLRVTGVVGAALGVLMVWLARG